MKFKLKLYPETRRLLCSTNLIQQSLLDLLPFHKVEAKEGIYLNFTPEEHRELKVQAETRGVSLTFLLNEALIKRGRELEKNREAKANKYLVIYLDTLIQMHPQIHDYSSLMQTCWQFYYVPSPLSGIYILTNRVHETAFKISEEAGALNVSMKKQFWHIETEEEYREHIPQGVKSYIGRLEWTQTTTENN